MPNLENLSISKNDDLLDCKEDIIKSVTKYLTKLKLFDVHGIGWDSDQIQKEHEFMKGKIKD